MNSCVYVHKRKDNNDVFYVGYGSIKRSKNKTNRSKSWFEIVAIAGGYDIEYLYKNLSKDQAKEIENNLLENPPENWKLINHKKKENIKDIDLNVCREYFFYDETSPTCLRWKKVHEKDKHNKINSVAGARQSRGCFKVTLFGKEYLVHRIVYALFYELDKTLIIDHIDRNPSNNKITNLRQVSHSVNSKNRNNTVNKSGVEGVSKIKVRNNEYWVASWYENCNLKNQYYSIKKLGNDVAFEKACLKRKEMHDSKK